MRLSPKIIMRERTERASECINTSLEEESLVESALTDNAVAQLGFNATRSKYRL